MVVGGDIAVLGDDEAAAGGGHDRGLLAEDVLGSRGVDAHAAVDVGLIELLVAHQRLAVHGYRVHLHRLAAADIDVRLLGRKDIPGRVPHAESAAHGHDAGQDNGGDLQAPAILVLLHMVSGLLFHRRTLSAGVGRGSRRLLAAALGGTIKGIEIIAIHIQTLLRKCEWTILRFSRTSLFLCSHYTGLLCLKCE